LAYHSVFIKIAETNRNYLVPGQIAAI
jgi:hypothetical protein